MKEVNSMTKVRNEPMENKFNDLLAIVKAMRKATKEKQVAEKELAQNTLCFAGGIKVGRAIERMNIA